MKDRLIEIAIWGLAAIIIVVLVVGLHFLFYWIGTHTASPVSCIFIKCIQVVNQ